MGVLSWVPRDFNSISRLLLNFFHGCLISTFKSIKFPLIEVAKQIYVLALIFCETTNSTCPKDVS